MATALLFLSGCSQAVVPQVERNEMRAELRAQRSRLEQLVPLAAKAYLSPAEVEKCPKVLSTAPKIECFAVTVDPGRNYRAVYLIQTDEKTREQIVSIRGTANLGDGFTDLDMRKSEDKLLGVKTHTGFRKFARAIYDDIKANQRLDPGYKIVTTGHSLGGAAALLLALYLYVDETRPYEVTGVWTFGQPKVLDNEGTTAWPFFARRVFRVVNCDDVVPIVPSGPTLLENVVSVRFFASGNVDNYQHMGQSLVLLDRGMYWMPGSIDLERNMAKSLGDSILDLAKGDKLDHSISQYQIRLQLIPTDVAQSTPRYPDRENFKSVCSRVAPTSAAAHLPPAQALVAAK